MLRPTLYKPTASLFDQACIAYRQHNGWTEATLKLMVEAAAKEKPLEAYFSIILLFKEILANSQQPQPYIDWLETLEQCLLSDLYADFGLHSFFLAAYINYYCLALATCDNQQLAHQAKTLAYLRAIELQAKPDACVRQLIQREFKQSLQELIHNLSAQLTNRWQDQARHFAQTLRHNPLAFFGEINPTESRLTTCLNRCLTLFQEYQATDNRYKLIIH
jgi:hypothetical protein